MYRALVRGLSGLWGPAALALSASGGPAFGSPQARPFDVLAPTRLNFYRRFELGPASAELITGAVDLHLLHSLSVYDALILQAAVVSGCQRVLSEDMQHGASFGGVRIENPFLAA